VTCSVFDSHRTRKDVHLVDRKREGSTVVAAAHVSPPQTERMNIEESHQESLNRLEQLNVARNVLDRRQEVQQALASTRSDASPSIGDGISEHLEIDDGSTACLVFAKSG